MIAGGEMTCGQPVRVRFTTGEGFGSGSEPDFYASGTVRDVRDDVILVEFPPVDQSVIRELDDPESDAAEGYALQCNANGAHGRHWFARSRIVEAA